MSCLDVTVKYQAIASSEYTKEVEVDSRTSAIASFVEFPSLSAEIFLCKGSIPVFVEPPPPPPPPPPQLPTIRINCGGDSFVGTDGSVWGADDHFSGGQTFSVENSITNTEDDLLFQKERYGSNFNYSIPIPNGNYQLRLGFAEAYWGLADRRVFSIFVQGNLYLSNFDIFAEAGRYVALVKTTNISVSDNTLSLEFTTKSNYAKINFIHIAPLQ